MTLLDETQLGEFIDARFAEPGDQLFRMERLPLYAVPHQSSDLERWLAGETEPNWTTKQPWLDRLADEHRRGLQSRRVRRFGATLTDDEICACHWGYAYTGKFEDIRVLHEGEHEFPGGLIEQDYWLVDDQHVLPMIYDEEGRFVGAEIAPPERLDEFRRDRDRAWAAAEPFFDWWGRHTELHRPAAT